MKKCFQSLIADPRTQVLGDLLGVDAQLHLVGGTLRDALLGRPSKDLDFASVILPDELSEILQTKGVRVIPTGLKHQTVTAIPVEDMPSVEITTFRGPDMSPEGGVFPSSSIEEDLRYRDFTINALALNVHSKELLDIFGCVKDLEARLLRCVGDPNARFREDPLRVLRMIRFASMDSFSVDKNTLDAAKGYAEQLPHISIERIRDEFSGIILSDRPQDGLRLMQDLGFMQLVLPEISRFVGFEQNDFHHLDLFEHTLEVVRNSHSNLVLRLAALFHDVGKPPTLSIDDDGRRHFFKHESVGRQMTRDILNRMRYPNNLAEDVATLVATHMRPLTVGPGGLRRILRDTGELFDVWLELKEADTKATMIDPEHIKADFKAFSETLEKVKEGPEVSPLKNLAINGHDLISLGMPEGREIGLMLFALHERVLDDPELNTKEHLVILAREILAKGPTE